MAAGALFVALLAAGITNAQPLPNGRTKHDCHVYALDIAEGKRLVEKMMARPDPKPEDFKNEAQKVEKILGRFQAEVGEEVATTKSYPLPGTRLIVTATVYYTDETMDSSVSMMQGLAIDKRPVESAIDHPGASFTEINLEKDTYKVRTKQRILIQDKPWIVGLECQCISSEEYEKSLNAGRK